jgi:(1->4)-alpha-D-glucan 1-alpha-D-glucosylmutase
VRHRIDVLSEQPAALRLGLRHWKAAIDRGRPMLDGERVPSHEDLYLLYQTLLGSLPAHGFRDGEIGPYRERIQAYMLKAIREAKVHASWDRPNEAYERALHDLIGRVLHERAGNALLDELLQRAADIAWLGALNSLSATVLKFASPGIPDTYQGTELIDLSLVDPDNRRPVDYTERRAVIEQFDNGADPHELALAATDGRIKLWCIRKLLRLRNEQPDLFSSGAYVPLRVRGTARNSAIGFARRDKDATLIVVACRKLASLNLARGELPGRDAWGDTQIPRPRWLDANAEGVDVLSGATVKLETGLLNLADIVERLPVAAILVHHGGKVLHR